MKRWCRRTKAPPDGGRLSGWTYSGPSYLDLAFHAAQDADPAALLAYNDAGCEQDTPGHDRFRKHVLELLDGLSETGCPGAGDGASGPPRRLRRPR